LVPSLALGSGENFKKLSPVRGSGPLRIEGDCGIEAGQFRESIGNRRQEFRDKHCINEWLDSEHRLIFFTLPY
jgi:hypothetical protein